MQITSADGRIVMMITDDIYNKSIYPQCDFSMIELPLEAKDAKKMYQQLYKEQSHFFTIQSATKEIATQSYE